jgi:polygalacturonase
MNPKTLAAMAAFALTLTACAFAREDAGSAASLAKPVLKRGSTLITDHGAKPDGVTLNTKAIQTAIDACHQAGGGKVVIPAGRFVTGTIHMKDNVTLHLDEGAALLGSMKLTDYDADIVGAVEAPAFNRCLIYAHKAKNIGFSGKGIVDGRGSPAAFPVKIGQKLGERPMLMRLVECEDISMKDVGFRNSASWGLHLLLCRNAHIDGIRIDSQNNNMNNDGIDLDGCVNVLIENCVINAGDDAICPKSTTTQVCSNIVVRDCTISSHTAAYKLGTSSRGGFVNMKVSNCRFHDCPMGAIKLLMVDGGRLENVEISNITMDNVGGPIFIRLGNRGRLYDKPTEQVYGKESTSEGAPVGILRKVRIRNIHAKVKGNQLDRLGIMISGIPGHKVEDVILEKITISLPGGGTAADAARVVPEDVARYPEQFFFGVLPSSVLYARHVKGLVVRDLDVTFEKPDARSPVYVEDVEGLEQTRVRCEVIAKDETVKRDTTPAAAEKTLADAPAMISNKTVSRLSPLMATSPTHAARP